MAMIETMVQRAINIANDDTHGYSWSDRWDIDFDCCSLMYECADYAGYPVGKGRDRTRYTGTVIDDFQAAGWTVYNYGEIEYFRGCMLLRDPWGKNGHIELYIGDGMCVGAHSSENGGVYGEPGDQTGDEISITPDYGNWWYVIVPPPDPVPEQKPGFAVNDMGLKYRAHVQDLGWQEWVHDGQIAGTYGFALRMEAFELNVTIEGLEVAVSAHVENEGWKSYGVARHGKKLIVGSTGKSQRMEAFIISVLKNTTGKQLEYRAHQQDYGWLPWTPAGFMTGCDGQARRLEAIQVRLV